MGFNFLGFGKTNIQNTEIEINFPFCVGKEKFIEWYIKRIYARILFDCRAKASGFSDKYDDALYDSYISTEMPFGLISLVVDAMYRRGKIGERDHGHATQKLVGRAKEWPDIEVPAKGKRTAYDQSENGRDRDRKSVV